MEKQKAKDFFKTFPYTSHEIAYDKYQIQYDKRITIVVSIINHKVTLAFGFSLFNQNDEILEAIKQQLINDFKIVEFKLEYYVATYKFFIYEFESLTKVIDILDQFLLMEKLS